jgi:predicted secreted Zn-dependent protease
LSPITTSTRPTRGIKAEIAAKRPEDGFGHRYDALTSWNYSWRWDGTSDGSCGVGGAVVKFNAQMQLPRLAHRQAVNPAVASAWNRYITALKKHEANHVRQAWQGREWVANEVRNSTCDEANRAGRRAIADIQVQSDNYDDYTRHGAIEGAVFKG